WQYRVGAAARIAAVRRREVATAVARDHHAVVVRADVDGVGVFGVDGDGVDLEALSICSHLPVAAAVRAHPEALGRAGVDGVGLRGVLEDGARAARLRRDAVDLAPRRARAARLVDAAARGHDDVVRVSVVNLDGEDVRVVNDAGLRDAPRLAAVR